MSKKVIQPTERPTSEKKPKPAAKPAAAAPPPKTQPSPAPLDDFAPLVTSNTAWKPNSKKSKDERLLGKTQGILNKITFEKFDALSQQLIKHIRSDIKTKKQLSAVVSQLFTKTVQEKHFGPLYADLCCKLADLSFSDEDYDGEITFKVALVNQCQKEFENGFKPVEIDPSLPQEEQEFKQLVAKQRALGTVAFIGQLYMKDLLPDKILKMCIINLVSGPSDLQIESAYQLLLIIGKKYDATDTGKAHLDKIFGRLADKSKSRMGDALKQRTKILVDILIGIRAKGWELNKKIEVAKRIEEIHEDFERERGGVTRVNTRGQATFDEYIFDATSKYSKQLKFALSGGCAIRRTRPAGPESKSDSKPFGGLGAINLDQFIVESSANTNDDTYDLHISDQVEMEDDGEEDIELMDPKDREEIKDTFIRTFFSDRNDPELTPEKALRKFVRTVKKMGWPDRATLVDNFLNFTFDMKAEEAYPLGQALARLCTDNYIKEDALIKGLDEWCEWYSTNQGDSPMLGMYFADIFVPLIRDKVLTLEQLNSALKKDTQIDAPKKSKEFGLRAEVLGYIIRQEPSLQFQPEDWNLKSEQIPAWKQKYGLEKIVMESSV